jgi:hypothetical protein
MNTTIDDPVGGVVSATLDAIEPDLLRSLVEDAIEQQLPPRQYAIAKVAEESEREHLLALARQEAGG